MNPTSAKLELSDAALAARIRRQAALLAELRADFASLSCDDVAEVALFGSWARGDFDSGSDIDLLVVTRGDALPAAALRTINRSARATRFDLVTVSAADWARRSVAHPFYARIAAERAPLWPAG